MKERKPRTASTALEFAYDRYLGEDKVEALEAELANAEVARKGYDLRTEAGLTRGSWPSSWGPRRRSSVGSKRPTTKGTRSRCSGESPRR